ncbi:hypothetical protein HUT16_34230 [Kitasatospora sp. NA04385]|uniref:hypothetical protein n=1 Tax=Kitasatospora sp. NA04385 TaxID=2742135 RepID=UPI001590C623|nr:hypothetical protein [Kitasatospora sp. NA04385]QKW23478.1 hypothetical protein HUT16_34230 [Kitasatospora sp. NA04385]
MHLRLLSAAGLLALAAGAAALAPALADEPAPQPSPSPSPSPSPAGTEPPAESPSPSPSSFLSPSPSPSSSPAAPLPDGAGTGQPGESAPPAARTSVAITGAAIDPKVPGRVRVALAYTCAPTDQPRSLNTSVEQNDPEDPATIAFGSTRTSPTLIVCDGAPQTQSVTVQSKTSNWLAGPDSVVITTLTDLGAAPPAAADARRIPLDLPPAP